MAVKKGFKDIEEYFLRIEAGSAPQKPVIRQKVQSRENLILQIRNLNEKLKGKDRKIKELYGELAELRSQLESLKEKEAEFRKVDEYIKNIEVLKGEIARLKGELAEKERQIESLKAKELPKARVELFIEVALGAVSELAVDDRFKLFFSRRFRKDMVREVSVRPFLFNSFTSAISKMDSTSRLLRRDGKYDIYRVRVTSPYGEYRAIYLKMDTHTLKFVRFGQRDSIYKELDASGWNFD